MFRKCVLALCVIYVWMIALSAVVPETACAADQKNEFNVGGALRYNLRYMDWDDEAYAKTNNDQGGEILLDTFRINVDGTYEDIGLSVEYRFYAGYHMLHHGYLEYSFTDNTSMQFGINQVPFGIQKYASHNWFFSLPYYLGLEDDYDMGLKLIHSRGPWTVKAAFYKGSEGNFTGSSDGSSRYSYDVVDETLWGMKSNNRETNQGNLRATYLLDHGDKGSTEFGLSAQAGQLYNNVLSEMGTHSAFAAHLNGTYGKWNVMLSGIRVDHDPKTADETSYPGQGDYDKRFVVMGAYDFPYKVASDGNLYAVGVSYSVPVSWGPISNLTFYNDFSMYEKDESGFNTSLHEIPGVMITAGKVYTYIDFAMGKNNPWLGEYSGLAEGVDDADWKMRFNVNVGYYF